MIDPTPWATRPHRGRKIVPLPLRAAHREHLEMLLRTDTTELRIARRAQGILLLAGGVCVSDVAMLVGVHDSTINDWKIRFAGDNPLARLTDAPRTGRPISLFRLPTRPASSRKRAGRPRM